MEPQNQALEQQILIIDIYRVEQAASLGKLQIDKHSIFKNTFP